MSQEPFPLFKGATRTAIYLGVPMMPLLVMVMGVAVISLTVSIFAWVLVIPLWFGMSQITKNDDKAFRVWWLFIDTKLRNRNKLFWEASSYSPTRFVKRR